MTTAAFTKQDKTMKRIEINTHTLRELTSMLAVVTPSSRIFTRLMQDIQLAMLLPDGANIYIVSCFDAETNNEILHLPCVSMKQVDAYIKTINASKL